MEKKCSSLESEIEALKEKVGEQNCPIMFVY